MSDPRPTVLLVDRHDDDRAALTDVLGQEFDVLTAPSASEALDLMREHWVQAVLCCQDIHDRPVRDLLHLIEAKWPETLRILLGTRPTTQAELDDAHVYQFLPKSSSAAQILLAARRAAEHFQLTRDREQLALEARLTPRAPSLETRRAELRANPQGFERVLHTPSSPLTALIETARQIASFDVPVLLTGEPGVGKATFAGAIHASSLRSDRPYHALTCTGLTETQLQAALFGTRRNGAPPKTGLLQKASRGTLFLNGVEALPLEFQDTLIQLLHTGRFQPMNEAEPISTDLRLITATSADLADRAGKGVFRMDLYYALAVTELALPALRARPMDIPLLAARLLQEASEAHAKPVHGLTDAAVDFLAQHPWPGNLAELRNEVTRMLILSQEPALGPELISRPILQAGPDRADTLPQSGTLKERVEIIETRILRETLTRLKWNKSRAAAELGLSRVGLRAKLDRYGLTPPQPEPQEG